MMACGDPRVAAFVLPVFDTFADAGLRDGRALSALGRLASEETVYAGISDRLFRLTEARRHVFVGAGLAKNAKEAYLSFGTTVNQPVQMTMCSIAMDGTISLVDRVEWPDPTTAVAATLEIKTPDRTRTDGRENSATSMIVVGVDFPLGVIPGGEAEFRLLNRYNCGECELYGIADLHVHQMAELAFGGRLLWGSHTGPQATALAEETYTGDLAGLGPVAALAKTLDILVDPEATVEFIAGNRLDANALVAAFMNKTDDEGYFQGGTAGAPNFESWPHHADRSHQQVHEDWLHMAVTSRTRTDENPDQGQNLALMVVSVVNNEFLCTLLTIGDGNGNVPTTGRVGSVSAGFGCTDSENLNRQIDAVHAMENLHPWYRVALSPWHAEQIVRDDDLAVVISMESDHPLSGPDGRYKQSNFVTVLDAYRARGVRSLQPAHEADSIFCGAALHRGTMDLLQKYQWKGVAGLEELQQGNPFNIDKGTLRNRRGLTTRGRTLVGAMVSRNMPIDLSHASIACQQGIIDGVPVGYGLYSSHTKFEALLRPVDRQPDFGGQVIAREKNFLIPVDMEQAYIDNEILIGLRTASIDVYSANGFVDGPFGLHLVPNDCPGSAKSFAQMVKYAADRGFKFAYGTDFNTGVSQLGPRYGGERCYAANPIDTLKRKQMHDDFRSTRPMVPMAPTQLQPSAQAATNLFVNNTNYYADGLAHIGWLPELTWDLQNEVEIFGLPFGATTLENPGRGVPAAQQLSQGASLFIQMWERAFVAGALASGSAPIGGPLRPVAALPASGRMAGVGCTTDTQCASGSCEGQLAGDATDRVCGCSAAAGCAPGSVCEKGSGQSFCVVPGLRLVGETCFSDTACGSGRCNAKDGRQGVCVCRLTPPSGQSDGCRVGTKCKAKVSFNEKILLPGLLPQLPFEVNRVCRP